MSKEDVIEVEGVVVEAMPNAMFLVEILSLIHIYFEGFGGNIEAAKKVGMAIAKRAADKGITKAVYDRGGFVYHGRVKALAEGAREGGLEL